MIIETITVNRLTREMTDLVAAYNIRILEISYDDFDEVLVVSYRANRIFESNEFKELIKLTDGFVK